MLPRQGKALGCTLECTGLNVAYSYGGTRKMMAVVRKREV